MRNVKDMLVSYFHFRQKWKKYLYNGTLEEFIDIFIKEQQENDVCHDLCWCDHVNDYTRYENIHFIHYEDAIEVCIKFMRRI
jgi:hypothetical protein